MILLDTCVVVWDALDPENITAKAKKAIDKAKLDNALMISDTTFWEIAMLVSKGRIELGTNPARFINLYIQSYSVTVEPVSAEIAELAFSFGELINKDPADRLIAATSIIHNATLVTPDSDLRRSKSLNTLW